MSNWRDRNERDAVPPTVTIRGKNDVDKPEDTRKRVDSTVLASLLAALGSIVAVFISVYDIKNSYSPFIKNSDNSSSIYICDRNESGEIETLVVDSNKKKRPFIVWNNSSSLSRCAEVAISLNKNKSNKLEHGKYITFEKTANFIRLCIVKDLNSSCDEENIIYNVNGSSQLDERQAIYSIDIDHCRIYPGIMLNKNSKVKNDRQVCFSPLQE
jgi:Circadian oscillating protein COP23